MNNKYKILLVEADGSSITGLLEQCGYKVITVQNLNSAQAVFNSFFPDLVLLNPDDFGYDGISFLKAIRSIASVPVIVISQSNNEADIVLALDIGANDYIVKPYGQLELPARIRAALRAYRCALAQGGTASSTFKLNSMAINYDSRSVELNGNDIKLTQTEYNILVLLSQHSGEVLSYAALIKAVWGYSYSGSIKKLQVNIANIRKKFGVTPLDTTYIINKPGVGYMMPGSK